MRSEAKHSFSLQVEENAAASPPDVAPWWIRGCRCRPGVRRWLACHGGSMQTNNAPGGSAEGRSINLICPEQPRFSGWIEPTPARRSPEAGEAAPRDDDSTRGQPRWLRWSPNRVHPDRPLRIERPSAAQGVDGKCRRRRPHQACRRGGCRCRLVEAQPWPPSGQYAVLQCAWPVTVAFRLTVRALSGGEDGEVGGGGGGDDV